MMHASGICPCCEPPTRFCPECGCEEVSANLPGYLVDRDGPNAPLVCEGCGHTWNEDDE